MKLEGEIRSARVDEAQRQHFLNAFPYFEECSSEQLNELLAASVVRTAARGTLVGTEGEHCSELFFVLSGGKRIFKRGDSGREVTLNEIGPGEICVFNALSILSHAALPASAESLSELTMLATPADAVVGLMHTNETMRMFVLDRIGASMASAMSLVGDIVFKSVDDRLKVYLLGHAEAGTVKATHRKIASALGSSREVVSRLLEDFERRSWVRLARNRIEIVDPEFRRRVS